MASLINKSGRWIVQWTDARTRRRPTIHLGKMSRESARRILGHVEILIGLAATGEPMRAGTSAWAKGLGDQLHARIAAAKAAGGATC